MSGSLRRRIEVELEQMALHLEQHRPLIAQATESRPEWRGVAVLALMLHGFYTGVERTLSRIAKDTGRLPSGGATWHRDLLQSAVSATDRSPAIISPELLERLEGLLAFRHFVRNAYAHQYEWDQMEPLVRELPETFAWVERDLRAFLAAWKS